LLFRARGLQRDPLFHFQHSLPGRAQGSAEGRRNLINALLVSGLARAVFCQIIDN
jgi:hypothetical protein